MVTVVTVQAGCTCMGVAPGVYVVKVHKVPAVHAASEPILNVFVVRAVAPPPLEHA